MFKKTLPIVLALTVSALTFVVPSAGAAPAAHAEPATNNCGSLNDYQPGENEIVIDMFFSNPGGIVPRTSNLDPGQAPYQYADIRTNTSDGLFASEGIQSASVTAKSVSLGDGTRSVITAVVRCLNTYDANGVLVLSEVKRDPGTNGNSRTINLDPRTTRRGNVVRVAQVMVVYLVTSGV